MAEKLIKIGDIANELCSCGHLKTSHNNTVASGHGDCKICDCAKFTWVKFMTHGEVFHHLKDSK